ncbi:MAG: hypothetical protein HOV80_32415 [Polyangiaceae bacterium]|nr:hypothetical protein [Polyangiaceae bacterium]
MPTGPRFSLSLLSVVRAALLAPLAFASLSACDDDPGHQPADRPRTSAPPVEKQAAAPAPPVPVKRTYTPARAGCDRVEVIIAGEPAGSICAEDAKAEGLTVVDLSDSWTPRVFSQNPEGKGPDYREKYLELARSPSADLGLHGIAPTLSVLAARLGDDKRISCDKDVGLAPIASATGFTSAAFKEAQNPKVRDAVVAIQRQLSCSSFMKSAEAGGRMTGSTQVALEAFRRRHMIVGRGIDADTVGALALGGEELAFRGLLRGLRERVADAAGLIEDGSASEQQALVQGRELDLSRFAPTTREALDGGAPDLVDQAADAAAHELGWKSPDAARAFLAARGKKPLADLRVAITLPKAPAYHSAAMELRVEIDRGDVFVDTPGAAAAARKKHGKVRGPTFVVYAKDGAREVPLVRWATTIGGWKKERTEDGEIALKFKESDVGDRVWRQIIAAPAWLPPDSTPETDLVSETKDGEVALKRDLIQPGYRNAYGLVMMIHHEASLKGDVTKWLDHGIRTHGSVDYRSIASGHSHGCHRLYNQLSLRLSGFLLEHRNTVRRGKMHTDFKKTIEYEGETIELDVPSRGYLYELDPPVPVKVLTGNVIGDEDKPISSVIKLDEPSQG